MLLMKLSKHSVQISRGKATRPWQGVCEFFHEDRRSLREIDQKLNTIIQTFVLFLVSTNKYILLFINMNKSYKLNVDCWFYHTAWDLLSFFKSPPPCHGLVTLPREICTECFERLVSNILQGDKMLHFFYFLYIFILIPLTKGSICY
jgi:hypothetical protein